jgi:NAD(P)H-hydrate epimerase
VSGSYGKIGAAVLASRAALRAGVGLLTTYVPRCGYSILQTAVPEAMALPATHETILTDCPPDLHSYNALGIGPGLGQAKETAAALGEILEKFAKPAVIDADALNILAANSALLHLVPRGSILTPHPKEFERLVGTWANDFERLEKQLVLAARLGSVIVLKGANTSIATPAGKVFFNSTGNPGMATGGTGDVLTGILTGLLAQRYTPEDAAILGVFLHGLAGDHAAYEKGMHSLTASDLPEFLPAAYRQVMA